MVPILFVIPVMNLLTWLRRIHVLLLLTGNLRLVRSRSRVREFVFLSVCRTGLNCVTIIKSGLIRIFLTSGLGVSTKYVMFGFRWDLHRPAIIRGVKLMIQAYVGDGSGFHTQVVIYE